MPTTKPRRFPKAAAAKAAAKDDTQLEGVKEPDAPPVPISGVKADTVDEMRSLRRALVDRKKSLKALSKKNADAGKDDAAKICDREAALIDERLLPQLAKQGALPLREGETLPQVMGRMFASEFGFKARSALARIPAKDGEKPEDTKARRDDVMDSLVTLIGNLSEVGAMIACTFYSDGIDRAYQRGLVGHTATPYNIALESLQAIEAARVVAA